MNDLTKAYGEWATRSKANKSVKERISAWYRKYQVTLLGLFAMAAIYTAVATPITLFLYAIALLLGGE